MPATSVTDAATPDATPAASAGVPAGHPRRALCLLIAVGWLVLDTVTKAVVVSRLTGRGPVHLVPGLLQLNLIRNPGSAFSLATGYTALLSLLAVAVVVAVIRLSRRLRSVGWAIALGLLLGGAAGNLADRIFREPGFLRGHVVDWIQIYHGSFSWPIFNVADSGITVAAVLVVLLSVTGRGVDGSLTVPKPRAAAGATAGSAAGAGAGATEPGTDR